jgi:hypothetical protein
MNGARGGSLRKVIEGVQNSQVPALDESGDVRMCPLQNQDVADLQGQPAELLRRQRPLPADPEHLNPVPLPEPRRFERRPDEGRTGQQDRLDETEIGNRGCRIRKLVFGPNFDAGGPLHPQKVLRPRLDEKNVAGVQNEIGPRGDGRHASTEDAQHLDVHLLAERELAE